MHQIPPQAKPPEGAHTHPLRLIEVAPHYRLWTGEKWVQVEDRPTWDDGWAIVLTDDGVFAARAGVKVWVG